MVTGAEIHLIRQAVTAVAKKLAPVLSTKVGDLRTARSAEWARPPVAEETAQGILEKMSGEQNNRLLSFLHSPDLEAMVHRLAITLMTTRHSPSAADEFTSATREELRQGIRHAVGLRTDHLMIVTDLVYDMVLTAGSTLAAAAGNQTGALQLAAAGSLASASIRNSQLLAGVQQIDNLYGYASELKKQIVKLHSTIRLPHLGASKSVPFEKLYVKPRLRLVDRLNATRGDLLLPEAALTELGQRTVIKGDPGAGKSTFARKLAHDVAFRHVTDRDMVPFLVTVRDLADRFREGGHVLASHLAVVSCQPYNLEPPPGAIDYLLLNARALVILDGLDELTDVSLRATVVEAIEGFMHLYPQTPIVVTSRKVGYEDAPLDATHFNEAQLYPFTPEQSAEYARNWFSLDEDTPPNERESLASNFIEDCHLVHDLSTNPLMLSLLCSTYRDKRSIPRNRAEVYEKCAVLMFETWDSRRAIPGPGFGAQLRAAVQHLAWQLLNRPDVDQDITAHELINELAAYFEKRTGNREQADTEARSFMEFCTGRAWVLTDIGASRTEPRYSFSHRTFMEYFAAEYLVRMCDSRAEEILTTLTPKIDRSKWDEIGQLAVQLLHRNSMSGAQRMLTKLLTGNTDNPDFRTARASFAARSLRFVAPNAPAIQAIAAEAVELAAIPPLEARFPSQFGNLAALTEQPPVNRLDAALSDLLTCLPENIPTVQRELAAAIRRHLDTRRKDDDGTMLVVAYLDHFATAGYGGDWMDFAAELRREHAATLDEWSRRAPWPLLRDPRSHDAVLEALRRFGPDVLYRTAHVHRIRVSIADWLILALTDGPLTVSARQGAADLLTRLAADLPQYDRVWLASDSRLHRSAVQLANIAEASDRLMAAGPALGGLLMLSLPYLEAAAGPDTAPSNPDRLLHAGPPHDLPSQLLLSRIAGGQGAVRDLLAAHLPGRHANFLDRWTHHGFSALTWT